MRKYCCCVSIISINNVNERERWSDEARLSGNQANSSVHIGKQLISEWFCFSWKTRSDCVFCGSLKNVSIMLFFVDQSLLLLGERKSIFTMFRYTRLDGSFAYLELDCQALVLENRFSPDLARHVSLPFLLDSRNFSYLIMLCGCWHFFFLHFCTQLTTH